MPPQAVELAPHAVGAVIAALLLFVSVLGLGTLVVRRLRLVADKPDGLRFEPSPPELSARTDRAHARQVAAVQARRRARWALAGAAWADAQQCREAADACPDAAGAHAEAVAAIRAALATATAAAAEAERLVRADDRAASDEDLAAHAAAAADARIAAVAALARLPDPGARRRRLLLIALAAFVLAWALGMLAITRLGGAIGP